MPDFFTLQCKKSLILSFAKGTDTFITNPNASWSSNETNLYNKYFPETNLYYYGPKYKIEKQDDLNTYYFKRLNKKGQDQGQYWKSLNTDNFVLNPYNYLEYQAIPLVNTDNESQFFRRVHGNAAGQVWSGIGTGVVSFSMFFIPIFGPALSAAA